MFRNSEGRSGRSLLGLAGAVVVLMSALIGVFVGTTGQERGMSMELGVVSFQMTPVSMAVFGVLVTTATLAVLFGLVNVASRYDDAELRG